MMALVHMPVAVTSSSTLWISPILLISQASYTSHTTCQDVGSLVTVADDTAATVAAYVTTTDVVIRTMIGKGML